MTNVSDDETEDRYLAVSSEDKGKSPANKLLQLPISRIKTIMKSSPELGNVSPESYFLITQATELFVKYLAKQAYKTCKDNASTVEYKSLAKLVSKDECLDFLEEIVPFKIKMAEYWKKFGHPVREVKEIKTNGSGSINPKSRPMPVNNSDAAKSTPVRSMKTPVTNNTPKNNSTPAITEVICID